jgi:predicted nucleotidyltransferase
MDNKNNLFDKRLTYFGKGKSKYLLKKKYQKEALSMTKMICKKLLSNKRIRKIWIGGSIVNGYLGKYIKKWNERDYSDIDLFILADKNKNINQIGLIRKMYVSGKKRYFRISVAYGDKPLKIFDTFSVDVWLFTPKSILRDLRDFPNLLKNTLEIE